jgi:hypothetical protein
VVGDLVGIDFRPVTVRKAISMDGEFISPNILAANLYAQKVTGRLVNRSIWDIEPAQRWIAPEDFYEQLIDKLRPRITWDYEVDFGARHAAARRELKPVINTAPLPMVLGSLNWFKDRPAVAVLDFAREPILVERFRIPGADVHQTIYFPSPETSLYRASITGDLLICESIARRAMEAQMPQEVAAQAFGIDVAALDPIEAVHQSFGKIAPIDAVARKSLLAALTAEHNIFSLGRFATWRNVLLDDVVQDARVIKRLMTAATYERRLSSI